MSETLTRKDQVLEVLRTGGHATTEVRECGHGLAYLFDGAGNPVPAWQQAITANLKPSACIVVIVNGARVWRLRA